MLTMNPEESLMDFLGRRIDDTRRDEVLSPHRNTVNNQVLHALLKDIRDINEKCNYEDDEYLYLEIKRMLRTRENDLKSGLFPPEFSTVYGIQAYTLVVDFLTEILKDTEIDVSINTRLAYEKTRSKLPTSATFLDYLKVDCNNIYLKVSNNEAAS